MEAVAKCCQQCILESGRKPTNRDLKGVFWGRYDKYLRKYGTLQHSIAQNVQIYISLTANEVELSPICTGKGLTGL